MKKATEEDEMPGEIDFSGGTRGRYRDRIGRGVTMVAIEPDVLEAFPDSASVNAALRRVLQADTRDMAEGVHASHGTK